MGEEKVGGGEPFLKTVLVICSVDVEYFYYRWNIDCVMILLSIDMSTCIFGFVGALTDAPIGQLVVPATQYHFSKTS